MKRSLLLGIISAAGCFGLAGFTVVALQPENAPPAKGQPGNADLGMMPGDAHKQLAKMVGDWTTETTLDMGGPAMPATKGTAKVTSILDGRFFTEAGDGEMMDMKFASSKMIGYNNATEKYEAVWAYTMSTGMMTMTGISEDDGVTISFDASSEQSPGKRDAVKIVRKWIDDDHFTVELTSEAEGMKIGMTTKYTRKK